MSDSSSTEPSAELPDVPSVRALTLYKHGLASVEREGPARERFAMRFAREQMSDVLKTLEVFVTEGDGLILSVRFDAPTDAQQELAARGFGLREGYAIEDLVNALRGRKVQVEVVRSVKEDDGDSTPVRETYEGIVVGMEGRMTQTRHARLALLALDQSLTILELDEVRALTPLESEASTDLAWVAERLRAVRSSEEKELEVRLEGSVARVGLRYALPAPAWRTVYRLGMGAESSELRLWAIVHNPLDEDLEEVTLTVTTGQPVSFAIDLYNPRHIARKEVEENFAMASGPVPVAPAMEMARSGAMAPPPAPAAPRKRMAKAKPARMEMAKVESSGEHFQLELARPVDIARGGSALVPLALVKVPSRRYCVWNPSRGANPDRVLELNNESGYVLEEGPVTLSDETGYAGEAMFPYTSKGAKALLVYARERGIRCRAIPHVIDRVVSLRFAEGKVFEVKERISIWTLVASSDLEEPAEVHFEVQRGREIEAPVVGEGPEAGLPAEVIPGYWRVKVAVAHGETRARLVIREPQEFHVAAAELGGRLEPWKEKGLLDPALQAAIARVVALRKEGERLRAQAEALTAGLGELRAEEKALQEQLGVLRAEGPEGERRLEIVAKLRGLEARGVAARESAEELRVASLARLQEAEDALTTLAQG